MTRGAALISPEIIHPLLYCLLFCQGRLCRAPTATLPLQISTANRRSRYASNFVQAAQLFFATVYSADLCFEIGCARVIHGKVFACGVLVDISGLA